MALADPTVETREELMRPRQFAVVIHNDDDTPFTLVEMILVDIFHFDGKAAENLAQEIDDHGSGVAGLFNKEVAEQRQYDAIEMSREHGYNLLVTVEADND